MLDSKNRYLQIAFNDDIKDINRIVPTLPYNNRILLEAGTPLIKRNGFLSIQALKLLWPGYVVADLKTADGALEEVELANSAGASAATVLGGASIETLDLFIQRCEELELDSMIDMIGIDDPLSVLRKLANPPKVVVLHKGRDEETTRGKVIQYKNVNKIMSKFDCLISAAGGVDLKEARSAIFNGAKIVVANIVDPDDPWTGIRKDEDVAEMARQFLTTIE
jgi:bifunctional enzyme Fae/Hps